MGLLGDFAKGFIIYMGVFAILALIGLIRVGLAMVALVLLIGLMIPLSWVALDYYKNRKRRKTDPDAS